MRKAEKKGRLIALLSPKFDRYVPRERRDGLLLRLAPLIEIVEVVQRVQASRDPDDDNMLDSRRLQTSLCRTTFAHHSAQREGGAPALPISV